MVRLYKSAYDGSEMHEIQKVFDDMPESEELKAYNTMTSLLNDAFQSCIIRSKGIDTANARKYYKTDDLPQGILTPEYLSNRLIVSIPKLKDKQDKVKEVFRKVLIISWCLAIGIYPYELRIPKIGSVFDAKWMVPNFRSALKVILPNQKIIAVSVPSLWMDELLCVKAEVFV